MLVRNFSGMSSSQELKRSNDFRSRREERVRPQAVPTASQFDVAVQLASTLQTQPPSASLVCGGDQTGKSAVISAAIRMARKQEMVYGCTCRSSANGNLQRLTAMLDALRQGDSSRRSLVLVVEHVERSSCCEALTQAVKRMAAHAGITVVFEVAEDMHGEDAVHAYCHSTRGLPTNAPLIITGMSSSDADVLTRNYWCCRYPSRHTPEYLPETLRAVAGGKVGVFPRVWRFAATLFDNANFVEPARVWEYLRPADEADGESVDQPDGPWPYYPDRRLIFEAERFLDALTAS